jgi:hypothetical protein
VNRESEYVITRYSVAFDPQEDGIRMDLMLGRLAEVTLIGFKWLMMGQLAGCCEYGDEP